MPKLPHNTHLKKYANENRNNPTLSEKYLWQKLKNKQMLGLDFDRQRIIGNYIVDFFCKSLNVVIEIDGDSHIDKQNEDMIKDNYLNSLEIHVLRIKDEDVMSRMDWVLEKIEEYLKKLIG